MNLPLFLQISGGFFAITGGLMGAYTFITKGPEERGANAQRNKDFESWKPTVEERFNGHERRISHIEGRLEAEALRD